MHIPDNYLSPSTCLAMGAVMVPVWGIAIKKVKAEVASIKMPMLGVGAAFSFLIMMFNVPLPGGTTGHAVGGTLLAILMGPWAACISLTIALFIQALIFGDGGILAFAANAFNMAFLLPFLGYFVYKFIKDKVKTEKGNMTAIAISSYIGINMAALAAAIEFGLQPLLFRNVAGFPIYSPYPLAISIPAMMLPHLLIAGVVEVIFTVAIYSFIKRVSPATIYKTGEEHIKPIYALLLGLICLSPLGLLASGTAWGEWGTQEIGAVVSNGNQLGFTPEGMLNGFKFSSIMPDYSIYGLPDYMGYILSAGFGVAIFVILFKIVSYKLNKREIKQ